MRPLGVLLLAFVLATASADAVLAQEGAAPDDYEQALSPYGDWVDGSEYGRIWRPAVSPGWQPYVDGYWASTPAGWTWIAPEPWAWTFHYGRWAYLPGLNWFWVPGYVYAPAWVDWYWGAGFVGWAPLPPFGTYALAINHYHFVNERDFCSPHVGRAIVGYDRVPRHVWRGWRGRSSRPPEVRHIERVGRYPVVHVSARARQDLVPRRDRQRDGDRVFIRPDRPTGRNDGWHRPNDRANRPDRAARRPPVVERRDREAPIVERPDHRPPAVTSVPVIRGRGSEHRVRQPSDIQVRPGAAPRPRDLGRRAPDAITQQPRMAFDAPRGGRGVDPSPRPPVVVNPGAGHLAPAPGGQPHGGGGWGSMARPRGGEGRGHGHVVPGAR